MLASAPVNRGVSFVSDGCRWRGRCATAWRRAAPRAGRARKRRTRLRSPPAPQPAWCRAGRAAAAARDGSRAAGDGENLRL